MCEGDLEQATALLSSHTNTAGSSYITQETGEGGGEGGGGEGGGGGGGGMETGVQGTPTRTGLKYLYCFVWYLRRLFPPSWRWWHG